MSKGRKPYGVLLVTGLRTHQENYALAFKADPRCRLIAVADEVDVPSHRAEWNRKFAEEMNLPYVPDLDDALARDDVDIVSVCSEHERRGRVAVKCAQAGKHLYLDKPMTCSVADADAVVAAVEKSGVRSQMFSFIHNPWAQAAKRALDSGVIGELVSVHCDVMFAKGNPGAAPLGVQRKQDPHPTRFTFIDSKRELRATGVYAVGLIRWLIGREVQKVFGVTANYFFAEHAKNDVEDFGLLSLTFDNQVTATVASGRIGWMSHPQGGPNNVYLIGTEGILKIDAYQPRIEVYADEPPWTKPPIHPEDPMSFWSSTQDEVNTPPKRGWVVIRDEVESSSDASRFIDCIESSRESEMSAKDGAAVVEVLMAGYVSAAKGDVVSLPLPR
ncbi:MAG: Gfo/Idh/MocA family protein [Candidatus Poribacteria bacterium]